MVLTAAEVEDALRRDPDEEEVVAADTIMADAAPLLAEQQPSNQQLEMSNVRIILLIKHSPSRWMTLLSSERIKKKTKFIF